MISGKNQDQEMLNIELTSTSPPKRLVYITSDRSDDYREQQNNKTGTPGYYTIEGDSIQLLPTPVSHFRVGIAPCIEGRSTRYTAAKLP